MSVWPPMCYNTVHGYPTNIWLAISSPLNHPVWLMKDHCSDTQFLYILLSQNWPISSLQRW